MTRTITRRKLIQGTALTAGAVVFGPWESNRVFAASSDKPIKIGLTHDASGQFANSGQAEKRGTIMAIDEANAALNRLLELDPGLTIERLLEIFRLSRYRNLDGMLDGLRKAGLPEK